MSDPGDFHLLVLDWLWVRGFRAEEVTSTDAYGSDYGGDTEGGFYPECTVNISYVSDGKPERLRVDGEDLASLWKHVTA